MPCPRLVVIGASAGGLEALHQVLGGLSAGFAAATVIVIHTGAGGTNLLPVVLGRWTPVPVKTARDGERIEGGRIYVPPPDCHILLDGDRLALSRGPRQHGFRPAVDPLFISAAGACGRAVIGVILSGALGDGTLGLTAIKRAGGLAVVQDPEEAAVPSMPLTALKTVEVDYVLAAEAIAPRLLQLVRRLPRGTRRAAREPAAAHASPQAPEVEARPDAEPRDWTPFVCPNCGGTLFTSDENGIAAYRCHVGHRFTAEALESLQADAVDRALWTAVRALHERAMLRRRMAAQAARQGLSALAGAWDRQASAAETNVAELRKVIEAVAPAIALASASLPAGAARGRRGGRPRRTSEQDPETRTSGNMKGLPRRVGGRGRG